MVCTPIIGTPSSTGFGTTRGILRSSFRTVRETFRNSNNVPSRTGTVHLKRCLKKCLNK
jgi:hypothetical protein